MLTRAQARWRGRTASLPPSIAGTIFPFGADDEAYAGFTPSIISNGSAVTWSVASGALPDGLSLNTSTGAITGTFTTPGTFAFAIKATDDNGDSNLLSVTGFEVVPTNLFSQGKNVSHADWSKDRSTIAEGAADPIGGTDAETILETTDNGGHSIGQTEGVAVGQFRRVSIIAPNGRPWVFMSSWNSDFSRYARAYFDLENAAVGTAVDDGSNWTLDDASISSLPNGYRKVEITFSVNGSTTLMNYLDTAQDDLTNSYVGDVTKGVNVFGQYLYKIA